VLEFNQILHSSSAVCHFSIRLPSQQTVDPPDVLGKLKIFLRDAY